MSRNARTAFHTVDWADDESVLAFCDSTVQDKEQYNAYWEREAALNIAWYRGFQYLLWNKNLGALQEYVGRPGTVRLVYNLIQPYLETRIANLGADRVNLAVRPATEDQADYEQARLATAVLSHYQNKLDWEGVVERVDRWMELTGDGYVKVCWNPDAGAEWDVEQETGMTRMQFREQYGELPPTRHGALEVFAISPLNLMWGPWGSEFDDAEWVCTYTERSIGYLVQRYGAAADELIPQKSGGELTIYRPGDLGGSGIYRRHAWDDSSVLVKELIVPRGAPGCPKGRHVVVAGNTVLKNTEHPYKHGKVWIVPFRLLLTPDLQHGESLVSQARMPQSDINRLMSQLVEIRETMASPRIMSRRGAIANPEMWSGAAGGINEWDIEKPEIWIGQGAPASVLINLQKCQAFMQDILGVRDVSNAKLPTGAKSGVAIRALKEADDARYAQIAMRRRKSWRRVGELMLSTIAEFERSEQLIRMAGDEGVWDTAKFVGSMLEMEQYDVQVDSNGQPRSRMTQMEEIGQLIQGQFLNPQNPEHARMVFKVFDLGMSGQTSDPYRDDRDQARRENETIAAGKYTEPRWCDNHEVHISEHMSRCKKDDFRRLDPMTQARFQMHVFGHYVEMAKKAKLPEIAMQIAMQQLMQTIPGGVPGFVPGAAGSQSAPQLPETATAAAPAALPAA